MTKTEKNTLFDEVLGHFQRLDEAEEIYGMSDEYTKHLRSEWVGATRIIRALGLYDEYIDYMTENFKPYRREVEE